jgi:starch synthase
MTALIPLYLKTHFKDDPTFRNSKVVYTVYDEEMTHPLPANFAEKARLDGIPAEMLEGTAGSSFMDVTRGGMKMADAITRAANPFGAQFEDYLKNTGLIVVSEPAADTGLQGTVNYYDALYQSILN